MKSRSLGLVTMVAGCLMVASVQAEIVAYDLHARLDTIRPDKPFKMGEDHGSRIFFDDSKVDPETGRVPVIGQEHSGVFKTLPQAWIDMKSKPWRYSNSYITYPVPGAQARNAWPQETTLVVAYPETRRWEIRDLKDGSVIIAAPYEFEKSKLTKEEIKAIMTPPQADKAGPAPSGPKAAGQ